MSAGSILITQGTQTGIPIDTVSGTTYPISKIDVGNLGSSVPWQGSVVVTTGTHNVGTVNTGTINTGTVNTGTINAGTINTGTINVGTVDAMSQLPPNVWGTVINVAGTAFGTVKAGIGGSTIYITDLTISMGLVSGTIAFYNGGTANPLAGTWSFNTNGGIVQNYRVPLQLTSGSPVTYQQQGTAAVSINAQGFIK